MPCSKIKDQKSFQSELDGLLQKRDSLHSDITSDYDSMTKLLLEVQVDRFEWLNGELKVKTKNRDLTLDFNSAIEIRGMAEEYITTLKYESEFSDNNNGFGGIAKKNQRTHQQLLKKKETHKVLMDKYCSMLKDENQRAMQDRTRGGGNSSSSRSSFLNTEKTLNSSDDVEYNLNTSGNVPAGELEEISVVATRKRSNKQVKNNNDNNGGGGTLSGTPKSKRTKSTVSRKEMNEFDCDISLDKGKGKKKQLPVVTTSQQTKKKLQIFGAKGKPKSKSTPKIISLSSASLKSKHINDNDSDSCDDMLGANSLSTKIDNKNNIKPSPPPLPSSSKLKTLKKIGTKLPKKSKISSKTSLVDMAASDSESGDDVMGAASLGTTKNNNNEKAIIRSNSSGSSSSVVCDKSPAKNDNAKKMFSFNFNKASAAVSSKDQDKPKKKRKLFMSSAIGKGVFKK